MIPKCRNDHKKHDTVEQIHKIVSLIRSALKGKTYCSAAFLDFAQAFGNVCNEGLILHEILESFCLER